MSKVYCWGNTVNGNLGLGGSEVMILSPTELEWTESENIDQVSCGNAHTIFLTNTGRIYSCGNNDKGQLGHEQQRKRPQIIQNLENYRIIQISTGSEHSLALNEWGQLFSWGSDTYGQLGLEGSAYQRTPKILRNLATSHIVQVCSGYYHSLALTNNGDLYAWGDNSHGQLGLGLGTDCAFISVPTLIMSLAGIPIAFLACGAYHSFAISKSGAVFGWGKNYYGQLGLNDEKMRIYPTQLKTLRSLGVRYISCGEDFSAFLTFDGGVFTCGFGKDGQLGHGSGSSEMLPRKIVELMGTTITQIACGKSHTLVFAPLKGRIFGFGQGQTGQLGTANTLNTFLPQVVGGPWVSPSESFLQSSLPDSKSPLMVRHIFSGGEQCIALVEEYSRKVQPFDCRIYDPKTQILTLSLELTQSCAEVPINENCDSELLTSLECIVRSHACFNASCLLADNGHLCCTSKHHGINLDEAKEIFTNLRKIESSCLKDIIYDGITVNLIPTLATNPADVETLRIYMLLPLYHEFVNTKNYKTLHTPFSYSVARLNSIPQQIVIKWWTEMDYFDVLVDNYRNVVSFIINFRFRSQINQETGQERKVITFDEDLAAALNFLSFLYKINHAERTHKCSYDMFVLPELSDHLHLVQTDYVHWLQSPTTFHLCNYPFLFDAKIKGTLLLTDQLIQMQNAVHNAQSEIILNLFHYLGPVSGDSQFVVLNVTRENIVDDTLRELRRYGPHDLKKPLKVKFHNEEAEDAGGVRKEFFMLLLKDILDPKYGMFKEFEDSRAIWFSECPFEDDENYFLIGILCGLAIYNFTIINLPFPLALYKKLLNESCDLSDLRDLSPTLANSMQSILEYSVDDFAEVFDLRFEVNQDVFGESKTVLLKPEGDKIVVNLENKKEFVDLYVDFIFNKSVGKRFDAFYNGFMKVVGSRVLQLFRPHELMAVIVGNEDYDWHALESETEYKNGYRSSDETIRWFWEVFHALELNDKKKFLLFLTGSDRIPIQGMKSIKIRIQPTNDERCLPVAHTCFNLLDLPRYSTKERLKYKLLQAIQQTQGFSLV